MLTIIKNNLASFEYTSVFLRIITIKNVLCRFYRIKSIKSEKLKFSIEELLRFTVGSVGNLILLEDYFLSTQNTPAEEFGISLLVKICILGSPNLTQGILRCFV